MANALNTYMTANFTGAQTTTPGAAGWYQGHGGANNNAYNCFAHAVGVTTRRINAQTRAQLDEAYSREHYFPVAATGAPHVGDAEVYTRPTEPNQIVHAHRVTGPNTAQSKLGPGELIDHHRGTLQTPREGTQNSWEYGRVAYRYRRDDAKFNAMYETTKSGRVRKRPATDDNQDAAKKAKTTTAASSSKTGSTSKPAAKPVVKPVAKPAAKPAAIKGAIRR
ncbi:hypothetical protein VM1G_06763 [Cytospora mali]|uniref:DUF7689 domain-containing protein n=1 Tax=Cytospora mali TaxID=578113 RepID=A0A194W494_CYTMA|nr:hypothetical protein VM1G_06763 [Valsa mali]